MGPEEEKQSCLEPPTPARSTAEPAPPAEQQQPPQSQPTAAPQTGVFGWMARTLDTIGARSDALDERFNVSKSCQSVGSGVGATINRTVDGIGSVVRTLDQKSDALDTRLGVTPRCQQVGDVAVGATTAVLSVPARLVGRTVGVADSAPEGARPAKELPEIRESEGGTTLRTVEGTVVGTAAAAAVAPTAVASPEQVALTAPALPATGSTAI